ncbi:MAG: hypothetical protein M1826_001869 [Phylliscum demangeonii]|nr:MAG: hypothetical protein M1826_001869 [Phylliscum demangeonii]
MSRADFPRSVPPTKYTAAEIASWTTDRPPPMEADGLSYRFPLDPAEFLRLEEILGERDDHWPRYEFDAGKGLGMVQLMPSPIHSEVHSFIHTSFGAAIIALPSAVRQHFKARTNVSFPELCRPSKKIPDFEFRVRNSGAGFYTTVFVVEMGFSQSHQSLQDDVVEWFRREPALRMVVVINVVEHPKYRNPLAGVDAPDVMLRLQGVNMAEASEPIADLPWTGVLLRGLAFVGTLDASLEIWTRGPDGRPEMQGTRREFIPQPEGEAEQALEFRLAEFSSRPEARDVIVPISWHELRGEVWQGAQELAYSRAVDAFNTACKAEGLMESDRPVQRG